MMVFSTKRSLTFSGIVAIFSLILISPQAFATPSIIQFGTTQNDVVSSVVASGGFVYTAGNQNNTGSDQTPQALASSGTAFLNKYDTSSNLVWSLTPSACTGNVASGAYGASADASGVYLAGYVNGFGVSGSCSLSSSVQMFLVKYDTNGNLVWAAPISSSGVTDVATAVSADSAGHVFVAGYTLGTLPGQTSAGGQDSFIREYNANSGALLNTLQFGTSGDELATGISSGPSGVYAVGYTTGVFSGQTSAGGTDAYVMKYNPATNVIGWLSEYGTSGLDYAFGVTQDSSGAYIAGDTTGNLSGTNAGGFDGYMRKVSLLGTAMWTQQFGTPSDDFGRAISLDSSGVYLAGHTLGAFPSQTNTGLDDVYVQAFATNGNAQWTQQFGTSDREIAFGIAADNSAVYIGGETFGTFSGQTSAGGWDSFLATQLNHKTVLTLNPVNNVVQGTDITLSGRLTDAVTGIPLEFQSITFTGNMSNPVPGTFTQGINIFTPSEVVTVGSCAIPSTCSPNTDARGLPIETNTVNYVQLPVDGTIEMPSGTVAAKLRIQSVDGTTGSFVAQINLNDEAGSYNQTGIISPYDLYLDVASSQTLQHGISSISISSISGESFVPVTSIISYDPTSNPSIKYLETFDGVSSVEGSLSLDQGAYVSIGQAPSLVASYVVQANYAGDTFDGYAPTSSILQAFSTLPQTFGTVGEPTTVTGFSGTGQTDLGACPANNIDINKDGVCSAWTSTTSTGGIPLNLFGGAGGTYFNLGWQYIFGTLCTNATPCLNSPSTDVLTHGSATGEKNVYVEVAYMKNHDPDAATLGTLVKLFHNHNINLHIIKQWVPVQPVQISSTNNNQPAHSTNLNVWADADNNSTNDFQSIKANNFAVPTASASWPFTAGTAPSTFVSGHPVFKALENTACTSQTSCNSAAPTWTWVTARGLQFPEVNAAGAADQHVLAAKSQVYHYGLMVHNIGSLTTTRACGPSGLALVNGADFVVATGCGFSGVNETSYLPLAGVVGDGRTANSNELSGTMLHELGHNFGLNHGGTQMLTNGTSVNSADYTMGCKPNYLSAMSYSRQLPNYLGANWVLDFSNYDSPGPYSKITSSSAGYIGTLNEGALTESATAGNLVLGTGSTNQYIVWGTPAFLNKQSFLKTQISSSPSAIDWDGSGSIGGALSADINNFGIPSCSDGQKTDKAYSINDWNNLAFNFRLNAQTLFGTDILYPNANSLPELALDTEVTSVGTPSSTGPTVTYNPQTIALHQTGVKPIYNCNPGDYAIVSCVASIVTLDSSSVGTKTYTVTATDSGGNSVTKTIQYYVGYKFSGFTSPIPNSKYNLGRSIPVKFQLLDYNNVVQTNGAAFCSVEYGATASTNTFPGVSCMPGSDSTSNTFKFDTKTKQYIYNLATSGYAVPTTKGPLTIIVQLDGGVQLITTNGSHGFVLADTVMLG